MGDGVSVGLGVGVGDGGTVGGGVGGGGAVGGGVAVGRGVNVAGGAVSVATKSTGGVAVCEMRDAGAMSGVAGNPNAHTATNVAASRPTRTPTTISCLNASVASAILGTVRLGT